MSFYKLFLVFLLIGSTVSQTVSAQFFQQPDITFYVGERTDDADVNAKNISGRFRLFDSLYTLGKSGKTIKPINGHEFEFKDGYLNIQGALRANFFVERLPADSTKKSKTYFRTHHELRASGLSNTTSALLYQTAEDTLQAAKDIKQVFAPLHNKMIFVDDVHACLVAILKKPYTYGCVGSIATPVNYTVFAGTQDVIFFFFGYKRNNEILAATMALRVK